MENTLSTRLEEGKAHIYELRLWLKQSKHTRSPWGEKLDRNGYAESLLESGDYCFICTKGGDLARHEVFGGADRETSKATGMWVKLCPVCHGLAHQHGIADKTLKIAAQYAFEERYTHEEFITLFSKNYI